jgi:hypothetical protein
LPERLSSGQVLLIRCYFRQIGSLFGVFDNLLPGMAAKCTCGLGMRAESPSG